jgi:hypothetical protein
MVTLYGEHVQTDETITRTVNYVIVKAQVDTNDIVVIPSVSTISVATVLNISNGATLTNTPSNNQVTITQAAQTDVDVLILAWE